MDRKKILTSREDKFISDTVLHYNKNVTPLTRTSVIELAEPINQVQWGERGTYFKLRRGLLDGLLKRKSNLKVVGFQSI